MPAASIIISYYKNLPALEVILLALNEQNTQDTFEVIISEDDNEVSTIDFINQIRHSLNYSIIHVSQEDKGFYKCACLNKSIVAANSDFLIFIDGDCIPHKKFVASYVKHKRSGVVLYGRRVMLSEKLSQSILNNRKTSKLHFINLMRYGCKRIEDGLFFPILNRFSKKKSSGILLGCNMGINKADLLSINGFDEDYTFPGGGEDSDIEWRFKKRGGIEFASVRNLSIVYHLWHEQRFDQEKEIKSTSFMNDKIKAGKFFCKNGLQKIS
ncbi:MAG: glycosyltransferase [Ferruginibacter sp.]|nr:glycosyltransferase [Ferruginibacter sp.]